MSVGAPQVAMVFMGMPIFILLSLTCILCLFCVIKTNIIFSIQKCQVDADIYQNKIKKSPQSAMGVYKQKINWKDKKGKITTKKME